MRIKTKRSIIVLVTMALALVALLGIVPVAHASNGIAKTTQLAMCLDGSGSISPTNWDIMLDGLADAVGNPTVLPGDKVELSIVQFADNITTGGGARVELAPIVITDANRAGVAAAIKLIDQAGGLTPLAAGIILATTQITTSSNFSTFEWQAINISTNGNPNVPGSARQAAEDAVTAAVAAGVDEVDVEGVGTSPDTVAWMAQDLVYPDGEGGIAGAIIVNVPPDTYPPRPPSSDFMGFVRVVSDFTEYAEAIEEKIDVITQPPAIPGMAGWGIVVAGMAMAVVAMVALRRTLAHQAR